MKTSNFTKFFLIVAVGTFASFGIAGFAVAKALDEDPSITNRLKDETPGVLLAMSHVHHNYQPHQDKWTFSMPTDTLYIKTVATDVEIITSDVKEVTITADGNLDSSFTSKLLETKFNNSELELKEPEDGTDKVKVTITLPATTLQTLKIKTVSGQFKISNAKVHDFIFKSVSGDLKATLTEAKDIKMETVSGAIECTPANGVSMQAKTVSGNVSLKVAESDKSEVTLKTVSGTINNAVGSHSGGIYEVSVKTVSGDITLN
jgi:DUF4097 and DUF4098 domain-containing protein YvlB